MRVAKSKRITAHDVTQLARFRSELDLIERLEREGVPRAVAVVRVFGEDKKEHGKKTDRNVRRVRARPRPGR